MVAAALSSRTYAALDHLPVGVVVVDSSFQVLFWNACLEDWTGVPRKDTLGADLRDLYPHIGGPRYAYRLAEVISGGAPAVFSSQLHPHLLPCPMRGGRLRVLHTVAAAIPAVAGPGRHLMLAVQDVTGLADALADLKSARDDLARQAATDPLTGAGNRRHFVVEAQRLYAAARRHARPLSVLLFDVDGFKAINDEHGHAAGDALLVGVVAAARGALRESDLLGRLGGDEFAVALPDTSADKARITAERMREGLVQAEVLVGSGRVRSSASFGLSGWEPPGAAPPTLEELLRQADDALYRAKRAGRNCVVVAGVDVAG
jgi:diguanylate cyclase (GGDEF)-like protein